VASDEDQPEQVIVDVVVHLVDVRLPERLTLTRQDRQDYFCGS
jgi:hypothetical protein